MDYMDNRGNYIGEVNLMPDYGSVTPISRGWVRYFRRADEVLSNGIVAIWYKTIARMHPSVTRKAFYEVS